MALWEIRHSMRIISIQPASCLGGSSAEHTCATPSLSNSQKDRSNSLLHRTMCGCWEEWSWVAFALMLKQHVECGSSRNSRLIEWSNKRGIQSDWFPAGFSFNQPLDNELRTTKNTNKQTEGFPLVSPSTFNFQPLTKRQGLNKKKQKVSRWFPFQLSTFRQRSTVNKKTHKQTNRRFPAAPKRGRVNTFSV